MIYKTVNISDIPDSEYKRFYSLMCSERQEKIDRFRFDADKKRSIAGEMLAKKMLADYLNITLEDITILPDSNGKPYALGIDVFFSISHSEELVICALNESPVGADIEKIKEVKTSLIDFVCSEREKAYVLENEHQSEQVNKRFYEIWTFKEAFIKRLGTGIVDLKKADFFGFEGTKQLIFKDDYIIHLVY